MKKGLTQKIPILDLNLSAFLSLNGIVPELLLQGTRVVFLFDANDTFYKLSSLYNSNENGILDYVNAQRQLKAMMMSLKNQK